MHSPLFASGIHLLGWLLSILAILALSVFGRSLQQQVTRFVDPMWLAGAVFLVLLFALIIIKARRPKDAFHSRVFFVTLMLLAAGGMALHAEYLVPIEVVHFLVFSCYGWLSNTVFGLFAGIVSVIIMSVGDEVLQHYLPDRVGDMHDVVINLISGIIGVFLNRR